jgi:CMP-N,N'-diacetyllegionaminic acid synthase
MNYLFTVCGRAGSKGFKNKNNKEFCGLPLIYYSMAAIKLFIDKNCTENDNAEVIVNTDSKELIEAVKKQSFLKTRIINRSKELCDGAVPKVDVIKDCFEQSKMKNELDFVIDLDITSPIRRVYDIENAIEIAKKSDTDVVFSVVPARRNPYFNMVCKQEDGDYGRVISSEFTERQQTPDIYDMNASIYVYNPESLVTKPSLTFFNNNLGISIMEETGILDIDGEDDFTLMQVIADYFYSTNPDFKEIRDEIINNSDN